MASPRPDPLHAPTTLDRVGPLMSRCHLPDWSTCILPPKACEGTPGYAAFTPSFSFSSSSPRNAACSSLQFHTLSLLTPTCVHPRIIDHVFGDFIVSSSFNHLVALRDNAFAITEWEGGDIKVQPSVPPHVRLDVKFLRLQI